MEEVRREITKEEYERAKENSPYDLISEATKMGYGAYCARVFEKEGKYFLTYEMGSSCD